MKALIPMVFLLSILGCGSAPAIQEYSHRPYEPQGKIPEKVVINKPFEQAWNHLIKELSTNFFNVVQIDKASRFVSIDASQDVGGIGRGNDWWLKYATCGTSARRITYNKKEQGYVYDPISTIAYEAAYQSGYKYWDVIAPKVSARINMNIYMSPINENTTEMSVNARYNFTKSASVKQYTYRRSGEYLFKRNTHMPAIQVAFTSQQPGLFPADITPPIYCYSKGELEKSVIELVK